MKYLCFDIGGTFIKYGLYDEQGQALAPTQKVATKVNQVDNQILQQVLDLTAQYMATDVLDGVAISTAGVVDSRDGSIRFAGPTIPGYTGTPLKSAIESQTGLPCCVVNDVNAALLGEYWQVYAQQAVHSLVCLTIGTGVGGAVLLEGQLVSGHTDMAGEIGYLPVADGTLQSFASTTALLEHAKQVHGVTLSGEAFFELVKSGKHPELEAVLTEFIQHLASGILSIIYLFNPEVIVIGGGILAQQDLLLPLLDQTLRQRVIDERFLTATIRAANLGNDAGMIGALYQLTQV